VVDRARHPRFAIGESSTPIADSILRELTTRFDLPNLTPLCTYGSARRELAHVTVGLKRGFCYFQHQPDQPFDVNLRQGNQLIVAASADDEHSDTHWLRSEVDQFFANQLDEEQIDLFEETEIVSIERHNGWRVMLCDSTGDSALRAGFIIDASGSAGVLLRALGVVKDAAGMLVNSRAIFGHFDGVTTWHDQFIKEGGDVAPHPFLCDHAAVHQLIRDGWMWQLGFDNGTISAGFALQRDAWAELENVDPIRQWETILRQYPSLRSQFSKSQLVAPPSGLQRTKRLQYLTQEIAGEDWVCLPATAGFVDPLHSTGIAHTMSGIEQLAEIFSDSQRESVDRTARLQSYAVRLRQEFWLIDRLVYACYLAINDFENFVAASMLYFAAATGYEHQRFASKGLPETARNQVMFLCANDHGFRECVDRAITALSSETAEKSPRNQRKSFPMVVKELLEPYNLVGLCDASVENMYQYTAAPEKTK